MVREASVKRISVCVLIFLSVTCFENALADSNPLIVGIAADDASFTPCLGWFKAGMANLGYTEGENIAYISYGFIKKDPPTSRPDLQKIVADNPDLLFTLGNFAALWAGNVSEKTGIPCLFSNISYDPVHEGIVESLGLPMRNATGIRIPDSIPKALEWLTTAAPGTKKIFLPYNPADEVSVLALEGLVEAASQLEIELALRQFSSAEETAAAILTLPEDIDAIFMVPSLNTDQENKALCQATIGRGLPVGAAVALSEEILVHFSPNPELDGKQAAQLANKILQGAAPADLPTETSRIILTINLKVAERLGIHVPDSVLVSADTIIR
jgi:putative ABC transport system substrate-binding protein